MALSLFTGETNSDYLKADHHKPGCYIIVFTRFLLKIEKSCTFCISYKHIDISRKRTISLLSMELVVNWRYVNVEIAFLLNDFPRKYINVCTCEGT